MSTPTKPTDNNNVKNSKPIAKVVDKNEPLTIGLCGQVSAGKTSFLNALCGGFIGGVSMSMETIKSEQIQLRVGAEQNFGLYEKEMLDIKKKNANIPLEKISEQISNEINIRQPNNPLPSLIGRDINIIDFPGVNNCFDKDGKLLNVVFANLEKLDILIYITSVETAFTLATEFELFNKIKTKVDELNKNSNTIYLITVVNKLDNPYDGEYQKVINNIPKEIKQKNHFFRVSSHKLFVHYLKICKIKRSFTPELLNELSKILKNANAIVTANIRKNIREGKTIDFEIIEYNNDILDDRDVIGTSGDWDELTEFIYKFDNYEIKKKLMSEYAVSHMKISVNNLLKTISKMMKHFTEPDYEIVKELIMIYFTQESASTDPGKFISTFYELNAAIQYSLLDKLYKNTNELNTIQLILFFENMEFFNNIDYYPQIVNWIKDPTLWNSSYNLSYNRYSKDGATKLIKLEHPLYHINGFQLSIILSRLYGCIIDFQGLLKLSTLKLKEIYNFKNTNSIRFKKILESFGGIYKNLKLRTKNLDMYNNDIDKNKPLLYHILTDITGQYFIDI